MQEEPGLKVGKTVILYKSRRRSWSSVAPRTRVRSLHFLPIIDPVLKANKINHLPKSDEYHSTRFRRVNMEFLPAVLSTSVSNAIKVDGNFLVRVCMHDSSRRF